MLLLTVILTAAIASHPKQQPDPCREVADQYFHEVARAGFTRNRKNVQTDARIPRALFELKMSSAFLTRAPVFPEDKPLAQQAQGDIINAASDVLRIAAPRAADLYHQLKPCISPKRHVKLADATVALVNAGVALLNARRDHPNRRALQRALDRIIAALDIMPEPMYGRRLRRPRVQSS